MEDVFICGGGIIGASVAYYLAKKNVKSTIIEKCDIGCAASGRAGGFLARDWNGSTPLGKLSKLSYDLHMELSKVFTNVDYRKVSTISLTVSDNSQIKKYKKRPNVELPDWIDGKICSSDFLGNETTTSQVHPYKLCKRLVEAAKDMVGTEVLEGSFTNLVTESNKVTGIIVNGKNIKCTTVVLSLGPWTNMFSEKLMLPKLMADPYYSIVIKPMGEITPHALFMNITLENGSTAEPEIYPRPDGTVYVCGEHDKPPLPDDPKLIKPSDDANEKLSKLANLVSTSIGSGNIEMSNCCYLPCSPDGLPLIGKVPSIEGAFIGTGHSCWGILNGPATGACLADLIFNKTCSLLDLSAFDPSRFV